MTVYVVFVLFFFFNDTATTEIYTLSLHDALPIYPIPRSSNRIGRPNHLVIRLFEAGLAVQGCAAVSSGRGPWSRSEEHTSELQSLAYLVCRLLLEKKKNQRNCMPPHLWPVPAHTS